MLQQHADDADTHLIACRVSSFWCQVFALRAQDRSRHIGNSQLSHNSSVLNHNFILHARLAIPTGLPDDTEMSASGTTPRLYDAHNHLQDEPFHGAQTELLATAQASGVAMMVVNGACESDWPDVLALARSHPDLVLPSFGYHPWYVREHTPDWEMNLAKMLDAVPSAIGEIGLDRWIENPDLPLQETLFTRQLCLAAERNLPASLHCLQAWGRLYDLLRTGPRPACGFLLHSYGGPAEMVAPLAKLGAFFSFPGYYLHERKARQRETFKIVPPDRLLVETDAPDQSLPPELNRFPLSDPASGKALNHPANLAAVYEGLATFLDEPPQHLIARVEENFQRLFAPVLKARSCI